MTTSKIGNLEKTGWRIAALLLFAAVIIENAYSCLAQTHAYLLTIAYNVSTSALTALSILLFQRIDINNNLKRIYVDQISGKYVRKLIQEPKSELNSELSNWNNDIEVLITHMSGHIIKIQTKYWEKDVEGIIEFSENSQFVGNGTYRYTNADEINIGTYKVQRFPDKPNILFVYYENTIPNNGAVGFEIWEKKSLNQ